jgi:hypothetical protein
MKQLSNYVRHRLAALAAHDEHPDADLLAAFAERAVAERERDSVLAHLATCNDCREVALLSLPEESAPVLQNVRSARRRLPIFRWAALAAGLSAVAVTALLVLPGRQQSHVYLARSVSLATTPTGERPPADAENPAPSLDSATTRHAEGAFSASSAMTRLHLPSEQAKLKKSETLNVPGLPTGAANKPAANRYDVFAGGAAANMAAASPAPQAKETDVAEMKTADAAAAQAAPARAPAPPLWRLHNGALLRSEDGGATWNTMVMDPPVSFEALAVLAAHVWAAAPGAVLYHSADGGKHWEILQPAFHGTPLRGTVASLEFADPQHGRLSSSAGATWNTTDGGRSWKKQ